MKISKYNITKEYNDKVLVYNSFSKSCIILEKDSDISCFNNIESFDKLTKNEKELLKKNGFVIDDNRNELSEIKYAYQQNFFKSDSLTIALVPTLTCNFACPYCFEKNLNCGKENIKEYFKSLKAYAVKNFKKYRNIQLSLFGGEPLIYIDECINFLKWVKTDSEKNRYNYITTITTNGSLLTENILEQLVNFNLKTLQITIDSERNIHDKNRIFKNGKPSFDLLIDKCNMVAKLIKEESKFKFIIRINLNNTNQSGVADTLNSINMENREKISLLFRAVYNTEQYKKSNTNNVNDLKSYYDLGTKMGFKILNEKYNFQTCEACGDKKFFYLMPDLSLWKCINDLSYKKCCIGTMKSDGNIKLNSTNVVNWYNNCMSAFENEKCLNCKMLPDCFGGCPLYKCKNNKNKCRTFDMSCLPSFYSE